MLGLGGDLAHRSSLARAVDAHKEHARRVGGYGVGLGLRERLSKKLHKRLLDLAHTGERLTLGTLAQTCDNLVGGAHADVSHEQGRLKVVPKLVAYLRTNLEEHVELAGDLLPRLVEAL